MPCCSRTSADAARSPKPPAAAAGHAAYAARIRGQAQMVLGDIAAAADSFDAGGEARAERPAVWTDIARFRRSIGNIGRRARRRRPRR
jgi:hypothetical protein